MPVKGGEDLCKGGILFRRLAAAAAAAAVADYVVDPMINAGGGG